MPWGRVLASAFIIALLCGVGGELAAQEGAADTSNRLQELERQRQDALRQERRAQQREHTFIPFELHESPEMERDSAGEECFSVEVVQLKGVTRFDQEQQDQWASPYQDRCLTRTDINHLVRTITQAYLEAGYVTSRAYLPPQDLSGGLFVVQVVEGRIEALDVQGAPQRIATTLLPSAEGDILNLRAIEQALDQINRLAGVRATVEFAPGDQVGGTVVVLKVDQDQWANVDVGVNNSGQESTGRRQGLVNVSLNNLTGYGDYLNLNYQRNIEGDRAEQSSESYGYHTSIPYGHWLVSIGGNQFDYLTLVEGSSRTFRSSGDSQAHRFTLERTLHRSQSSKTSAELLLKQQENNNYLEDVRLETSSVRYRAAELTLNHERYFQQGSTLLLAASYVKGLDNNLSGEVSSFYTESFEKLNVNVSYRAPVPIPGNNTQWSSRFSAQYSEDSLYSAESLSLGSRYTVRGFEQDGVSGANGGYWRNEISQTYFPSTRFSRYSVSPYLGLDVGRVSGGETLAGVTVGVRASGRYINLELFYSEPVKAPERFERKDNQDFGFSVTMKASW
ncbi:ShlB/FhaC/HecB family hemolysin secretion/activation protein [Marinimicrobium sp. LS-A18]|uniref:ShlB/FhaC/HecB family hemolysin secretion/activation protein n=1 Tax=Marinimicrobium sp. LS-A18 TaxID=1381596 RepID=UPI0009DBA6F5|nr:ShlB/FhaC/HecB family hemolysin secretion/activation protein [Marinimicrobium sp. LS-A18]